MYVCMEQTGRRQLQLTSGTATSAANGMGMYTSRHYPITPNERIPQFVRIHFGLDPNLRFVHPDRGTVPTQINRAEDQQSQYSPAG